VTAPATPEWTGLPINTPLDRLEALMDVAHDTDALDVFHASDRSALAVTRALVEAALGYPCPFCGAVSHHDCQRDCPQRVYRAWHPATGSGDSGEAGGEGE